MTTTGSMEPHYRTGALSLYWLMQSSFNLRAVESQPAQLTPSSFYADIKNSSTTNRLSNFSSSSTVRIYYSSATQPVITTYKPPMVLSDGMSIQSSTNSVLLTACYLFKSSTTATRRVASAEDTRGRTLKNSDAGCIPTAIDFGSAPVAMLISSTSVLASTNSVGGAEPRPNIHPPSHPAGTLFYWVSATTAASAASSQLHFVSSGPAAGNINYLVPGLVFDSPTANTRYDWDPPWRSTSTVQYNAPTAGPRITFCTRGIKEQAER